jgi:hypothetical protein
MSERDTDIEFDFFDEPETQEAPRRERAPRPGGPPRPPAGPPTGLTPLLRLVGLVAFAILLVILLVVAIQSCQESGNRAKYENYMKRVSDIGVDSQQIGRDLTSALTSASLKEPALERRLAGLARRQELDVQHARDITPPARLEEEHRNLIESLQFRVNGLVGLQRAFHETASTKSTTEAATTLAGQAARLLASDVVWDDNFKDPARRVLAGQGVHVTVPDSNFLENPELASSGSLASILDRIRGAQTGVTHGGLHGTGLVTVKALPNGTELSTSTEKTVIATDQLAFSVTVKDTGDSRELNIPVTLTIQQSGAPIVKHSTIDVIDPGQEKTIVFTHIGAVNLTSPTTIKVDVSPVPGETRTSNNTAEYKVLFSLPAP